LSSIGRSGRANSDGEKSSISKRKPIIWKDNTMKPKPKEQKPGVIVDWLSKQRVKRQDD